MLDLSLLPDKKPQFRIVSIDPGTRESAWTLFDCMTNKPEKFAKEPNIDVLNRIRKRDFAGGRTLHHLVIEKVASYGMAVGAEVFETVFWTGRFAEAWKHEPSVSRIFRKEVCIVVCNNGRAKDTHVRQALIDIYGGKDVAIGHKNKVNKPPTEGILFGVANDVWAALAVGYAWTEMQRRRQMPRV